MPLDNIDDDVKDSNDDDDNDGGIAGNNDQVIQTELSNTYDEKYEKK